MTNHVVTWKRIAEQANELYPKSLRVNTQPHADDDYEYISGAVMPKPTEESDDSFLYSDKDEIQNTSPNTVKQPLTKRIEFALAKYAKKKDRAENKPQRQYILHNFRMSGGKIDISRLINDKEDLQRYDLQW